MSEEMMECPHCGTKHKKRTEEEKKSTAAQIEKGRGTDQRN